MLDERIPGHQPVVTGQHGQRRGVLTTTKKDQTELVDRSTDITEAHVDEAELAEMSTV